MFQSALDEVLGLLFFFKADVICTVEAFFGLGRDGSRDIIPLSLPSMPFSLCPNISLPVYTFSVRKTDMSLVFMLECAGQERVCEHCAKCFLVTYLLVF